MDGIKKNLTVSSSPLIVLVVERFLVSRTQVVEKTQHARQKMITSFYSPFVFNNLLSKKQSFLLRY
jgi:hypothetical protein